MMNLKINDKDHPGFSVYRELLEISLEYFPEETQPLQDCLIVGMQHMLGTTVDMFRAMKKLGLRHAIVGSKLYSDNLASINAFKRLGYQHVGYQQPTGYGLYHESITKDVHEIWKNALQAIKLSSFRSIIVLDDGADLLLNIPSEIYEFCRSKECFLAGIEQTRGGSNRTFFNGLSLPIIHVAGSAIKTQFESQWIAEEVVRILRNDFFDEIEQQLRRKPRIGVMGHGAIGHAIAKTLSQQTSLISIYDPKTGMGWENSAVTHFSTPSLLVSWADVIIGCTGTDVTADSTVFDALHYSPSVKWLVSTSSKDVEFNCLLHAHQRQIKQLYRSPDVLQTAIYRNYYGIPINVLRGGFPINFRNTLHSVPPKKIWPTRAALLLGCLMALKDRETLITNDVSTVHQLDPYAQTLVYRRYAQIHPEDPQIESISSLNDEELRQHFRKYSQGKQSETYQELCSNI